MKQSFRCDLENLIKYSASAVNVILSNSCVVPLPRIKASYFNFQNVQRSLYQLQNKPESKFGIEKSEQEQNPMPHLK